MKETPKYLFYLDFVWFSGNSLGSTEPFLYRPILMQNKAYILQRAQKKTPPLRGVSIQLPKLL